MTEREKVIGLLKETAEYFRECRSNASFASKAENHFWELQNAANEVVNLLKEQEPVEPIPPTDESDLWRCGNCNHQLFRCTHQRYCDMCGKAVKWE